MAEKGAFTKWKRGRTVTPAEDAAYREVWDRYHNADGTERPGWMKAPNGKPTKLTEQQWVMVRTSSFKRWFGDWEARAELYSSDMENAKRIFRDLVSRNAELRTADGATMRFVSQSSKAYSKSAELESDSKTAHWCAVANIENLISRARFMYEESPRNGSNDILAYVKYGTLFTFRGELYLAKITSKKYPGNDLQNFYNVESVSVEKIAARGIHEAISKGQPLDTSSMRRISNIIGGVNEVSKVVGENGEPLVVYHGSNHNHTTYHRNESFHVSDIEVAKSYAKRDDKAVQGNFLNIRNPLVIDAGGSSWCFATTRTG